VSGEGGALPYRFKFRGEDKTEEFWGLTVTKKNLILKSMIIWVLTPSSSERDRRFGGTYSFIQGRRISQARNQQSMFGLPPTSAGYFLGLPFEPEDGGDMFLRNVMAVFELLGVKLRTSHSSKAQL
jgi:hypothetical protein